MSSESTPVLSRAISDFKMFMTEWEKLRVQHQVLKFWTKISLHWAKKYYIRMDKTDAYVVTMCKIYLSLICHHFSPQLKLTVLNPAICFLWINSEWETSYIQRSKDTILDLVSTIY